MKTNLMKSVMCNILLSSSSRAFIRNNIPTSRLVSASVAASQLFSTASETDVTAASQNKTEFNSPWDRTYLAKRAKGSNNAYRARQHVNPLASKFQQPTVLTPNWPHDAFEDLSKPVFLDIGCSRGGFLIDMATNRLEGGENSENKYLQLDYNYLGLEIRPIVVYHAQQRIEERTEEPSLKGKVDFVGCNANVDLERLLILLGEGKDLDLQMVSIQFPDPHFKARHAKRRVVRPELVTTLAKFMPPGSTVWLQSDIQSVLDDMRLQFRLQKEYFEDSISPEIEITGDEEEEEDTIQLEYVKENILGVPTEREASVLENGLPVYRALFTRTDTPASY